MSDTNVVTNELIPKMKPIKHKAASNALIEVNVWIKVDNRSPIGVWQLNGYLKNQNGTLNKNHMRSREGRKTYEAG